MRLRFLIVPAMLAAASAMPVSAQAPTDSLRMLDRFWARTYATHDTTLADRLLADRLVVTSGSGTLKTKAEEIGDVRPAPGLQMEYFCTTDVQIEVYPQTGIVTGLAQWAFTYNGQERSMRRRYTAVYVRGGPLGWQMAALQIGMAPGQSPPEPSRPCTDVATDTSFAAMQERGKAAMGVDQYTSSHVFESLPDGGRIVLQRDSTDSVGTAAIRAHLAGIAASFSSGDFQVPGFVHAQTVPGTAVMTELRASITYAMDTLPRGGEVRIQSSDSSAVAAIHQFLDFQRSAHHAAGHTEHEGGM